jgi:hypothetical protein
MPARALGRAPAARSCSDAAWTAPAVAGQRQAMLRHDGGSEWRRRKRTAKLCSTLRKEGGVGPAQPKREGMGRRRDSLNSGGRRLDEVKSRSGELGSGCRGLYSTRRGGTAEERKHGCGGGALVSTARRAWLRRPRTTVARLLRTRVAGAGSFLHSRTRRLDGCRPAR